MEDHSGEDRRNFLDSDFSESEPAWVKAILRFLPAPIFAVTAVIGCLIMATLFLLLALINGETICWSLVGLFVFLSIIISSASIIRHLQHTEKPASNRYEETEAKPTFSIVVLMVWMYSWLLTIGWYIYDTFFRDGPGSTKYYVTLCIAIVSALFMHLHGFKVIHKHFGAKGGSGVSLTGSQALVVLGVVLGFVLYFLWLLI